MSDSLEVAGVAGTWVATGLAIIALLGIIGPFYAMKAAYSKRNRALNMVYDAPGRYLTKGISIGKGSALFRWPKVPNLAPNHDNNGYATAVLLPDGEKPAEYCYLENSSHEMWMWNTGWARLCALIQSHHKSPVDESNMCKDTVDGTLEILDTNTALVVSRYWILFTGLLGVYETRKTEPNGQSPHFQHWDLDSREENLGFNARRPLPPRYADMYDDETTSTSIVDDVTSAPRPPPTIMKRIRHISAMFESATLWPGAASSRDYGTGGYYVTYSKFGTPVFSHALPRKIEGYTGVFESLGRHKNSIGTRSLVKFRRQAVRHGYAGTTQSQDSESRKLIKPGLSCRFWFAFGFLPTGTDEVMSFLDPFRYEDHTEDIIASFEPDKDVPRYLRMQVTEELPGILTQSCKALKVDSNCTKLKTFQWKTCLEENVDSRQWYVADVFERETWLWKRDIVKCLKALLRIDYDDWGFLVCKSPCKLWDQLLDRPIFASDMYRMISAFLDNMRQQKLQGEPIPGSDLPRKLYPHLLSKIQDYVQFEKELDELMEVDLKWTRYPIAIAFIMDKDLRDDVKEIFLRYASEADPGKSKDMPGKKPIHPAKPRTTASKDAEKWSNIGKRPHTMSNDCYALVYTNPWSANDEAQVVADRLLLSNETQEPPPTKSETLEHTVMGDISLEYCPVTDPNPLAGSGGASDVLQLHWKRKRKNGQTMVMEIPGYDHSLFVSTSNSKADAVHLQEEDILLIAIWAVMRCALWKISPDSQPLLEFINELDRNVLVL